MLQLSSLLIGAVLLVLVAPRAYTETCSSLSRLSNVEIVGAMPPETESVLILRVRELKRPGSLIADWIEYMENPEAGSDLGYNGEPDVSLMVENSIARAGLHTVVWAGSRFVQPVGIGASRFDTRKVFITENSLEELQATFQVEAARSSLIETGAIGDLRYFEMAVTKQSGSDGVKVPGERLVSFLDPCTIVLAETPEELASLTRSLKDPDGSGSLVRLAPGIAADAPVSIVRTVKPPRMDQGEDRIMDTRDMALAAALPDPTKPRFEISLTTDLAEKEALEYFQEVVVAYLMPESAYELRLDPSSRGYQGYFEVKPNPNEPHYYLEFVSLWFFGMWMTI